MNNYDRKGFVYRVYHLTKNFSTRKQWYHLFKMISHLKDNNEFNQKELFFMTYKIYLNSLPWKNFKNKIIEKRGLKCEECGYDKISSAIQLHHLTYICVGNEMETHVKLLCKLCHKNIHEEKMHEFSFDYDDGIGNDINLEKEMEGL